MIPTFSQENVVCFLSPDGKKMIHIPEKNTAALEAAAKNGFVQTSITPCIKVTYQKDVIYIPQIPVNVPISV